LLKAFELDGLYLMYKARGRAFRETPPPSDWDGVFDALSK
jgi:adenylate cyclase